MSIITKISKKFANRNNKNKINYLRKQGMIIGERNHFYCPIENFGTEPFLIKVGNGCSFTSSVIFITHDGGVGMLNRLDLFPNKEKMVKMSPIIIGDNVYIGLHTVILPGVHIGNNVVIGAGSIVTKDIPDNSCAAGNPAKVICTLQEYADKSVKNNKVWSDLDGTSLEYKRKYFESIDILNKF